MIAPKQKISVEILGSGTSTGVPVPGCDCTVCKSSDPRDNRLRTSAYFSIKTKTANVAILIDTPPDLRTQLLRSDIKLLDLVLYTHPHADHINGIDDLRIFNFINKRPLPLYGTQSTVTTLTTMFGYAFNHNPDYEGGAPPQLEPKVIYHGQPFTFSGIEIIPIELIHGKILVTGYRIGSVAYLPDCNEIPQSSMERLHGLELLIIDGLRDAPHKTHFTQREAISVIEKLQPKRSLLTHISHDILHSARELELKTWSECQIELAYDQLKIEL